MLDFPWLNNAIDFVGQGVADPNEEAYLTHVCSTSFLNVAAPLPEITDML